MAKDLLLTREQFTQRYGYDPEGADTTPKPWAGMDGKGATTKPKEVLLTREQYIKQYGKDPETGGKIEGPSTGEAVARGGYQGLTAGFGDELTGIGSAVGEAAHKLFGKTDPNVPKTSLADAYRQGRDKHRAGDTAAADANPLAYGIANVGGAIATAPIGGVGGGLARVAARGAATGAAYGAGGSNADLTKDDNGVQFVKDTLVGGVSGAALGAAGHAAGAGVKAVAGKVKGGLERRILNEVAEGTASTTPTGRKRLLAADKSIVREVIKGPDAKDVRAAYLGDADKGRAKLEPVISKIGAKNAKAYEAFEKVGAKDGPWASSVDGRKLSAPSAANLSSYDYLAKLEAKATDAMKKGKTRDAQAIRAFAERAHETAKETGGLTITQLRGLTTEAQGIASSVLGSLNEHANAVVARRMSAVVSEAMGEAMQKAAGSDKTLQAAASTITKNNRRLHALLTIDDSLKLRAAKEGTRPGLLVQGAKALAAPTGAATVAGLASGDENKVQNMVMGAAAGFGAVPFARAVERGVTGAAIRAAQGKSPVSLTTAQRIARGIGRAGAAGYAGSRDED